uniref:Synaptobrevin, longin-like domain protein n=1 Tax=Tanacetum cinerariifolium TaxID=118510 RepID=A0A6L2JCD1_TANCI|nr:hypothetical protein [Tanacetum cinerariifolium]
MTLTFADTPIWLPTSANLTQSDDVTRLQALVDKKKVVVTKAAIRDVLHLDDAEGIECLPMKRFLLNWLAWDMRSRRKFNFSKYIFESLVRNVDSSSKFYMYPGFIHLIIQNQLGDLLTHTTKYISPTLTQKGDAEEHGNDDNAAEEPVTAVDDVEDQSIPSPTPPSQQTQDIPSISQAQSPPPQPQSSTPAQPQGVNFPMSLLQEALDTYAALPRGDEHLEHDNRIELSDDTIMKDVSNQGRMIDELDKDEGVVLMNEKEETEELKDITGDAQNQLGDLSTHTTKYISPALTQKVFANIRMVGKGCSGVDTPLFEGISIYSITHSIYSTITTTLRYTIYITSTIHSTTTIIFNPNQPQGVDFPINLLQEALDTCAALTRRVKHLEHDKVAQNLEITKLKIRVKKLERANKVKTLKLRRLRKVGTSQRIESSDDTIIKDVSNQGRMIDELDKDEGAVLMNEKEEIEEDKDITGDAQVEGSETVNAAPVVPTVTTVVVPTITTAPVKVVVPFTKRRRRVVIRDSEEESSAKTLTKTKSKDKGKGIMVEEPKPLKKKQQVELDEALDYFKGMSYDDIRPIFEAKFNSNIEFLLKSKEQMEEEENKAIASINENPAQKAAKRRRLNEEAEDVKELK